MDGHELTDAERRVWAAVPAGTRAALTGLSGADLRTLLLGVARDRAATVHPADVVRRWREDRFVRPARADPRALAQLEARMWQLLPADVCGVELSPVVPVGTCTAVAPVSQNRIVTTMRASEVLSDPTNALAIEAALRRRRGGEVHLAAAHRVLRAQDFGGGASAHFRLFALVSSARDAGSGSTQARLLIRHLTYWRTVLTDLAPAAVPQLHITVFDDEVIRERLADTVRPALDGNAASAGDAQALGQPLVPLVDEPERRRGRSYYTGCAIRITVRGGSLEVGDGGLTDWTARLSGDAKERCLVSCLATERLVDSGAR
ncbi:hypothetical protein ADK66_08765 [Micromonospora sp. NRRL B-16802]|uniref:hypothetical protein n=1 Tax=Micromonospora sp. NRRL B-16802 TaxID=1415541 RepID=UPI0006B02A4B|nr:hypothetical protein [Micromonospora sp. NRRL B-16802]KOX10570.1 hypothetical protein ADK66_08765 [Micromonospora sp. NRRL B-16802]